MVAKRSDERPTPCELFNLAAEAIGSGDTSGAVTSLRGGFFGNLYVAPILIGEEFHPQRIWHESSDAEPQAAKDYVARYGRLWNDNARALEFLTVVWNDPLVRAELRSFLNLSRNLLSTRGRPEREDLLRERDRFLDPERIKRTQTEILSRLQRSRLDTPVQKPRLGLVLLAARQPAESVEFYRRLLEMEPVMTSRADGGYAEFELDGVHLAIHGQDRPADGDPYELGPPPSCMGWGAIFVIRVAELDRYYDNALESQIDIVDSDLLTPGRRFFVVKDPSGYLLEITEEG